MFCRVGTSNQGSPKRGMPSQGADNSPLGSPSASAAFSPGALAGADDSSASPSSPAQSSSPERGYSLQLSQLGRAPMQEEAAVLQDPAETLEVRQDFEIFHQPGLCAASSLHVNSHIQVCVSAAV